MKPIVMRTFKPVSKNLYYFDPAKLKAGDVVLESGSRLSSKTIRIVDGGEYSHALIWVGEYNFVEAVSSGVRRISIGRILIQDTSKWSVLRLIAAPDIAEDAAICAKQLVGAKYSIRSAVRSVSPRRSKKSDRGLFCSKLIAESYARAGIQLCPGYSPDEITPARLQYHSILTLVKAPLIEIPKEYVSEMKGLMDRDAAYRESVRQAENTASTEILRITVREMKKINNSDVDAFLQISPRSLNELLSILMFNPGTTASRLLDIIRAEFTSRDYYECYWISPLRESLSDARQRLESIRKTGKNNWPTLFDPRQSKVSRARLSRNIGLLMEAYGASGHPFWLEEIQAYNTFSKLQAEVDLVLEASESTAQVGG